LLKTKGFRRSNREPFFFSAPAMHEQENDLPNAASIREMLQSAFDEAALEVE